MVWRCRGSVHADDWRHRHQRRIDEARVLHHFTASCAAFSTSKRYYHTELNPESNRIIKESWLSILAIVCIQTGIQRLTRACANALVWTRMRSVQRCLDAHLSKYREYEFTWKCQLSSNNPDFKLIVQSMTIIVCFDERELINYLHIENKYFKYKYIFNQE